MDHKIVLIYFILFIFSIAILSFLSFNIKKYYPKKYKEYMLYFIAFTLIFLKIIIWNYAFRHSTLSKIYYESIYVTGIILGMFFYIIYIYSFQKILEKKTDMKIKIAFLAVTAIVFVIALFSGKIISNYNVIVLKPVFYTMNIYSLLTGIYIIWNTIYYNIENQKKGFENIFILNFGLLVPVGFFDSLHFRGNKIINFGEKFDIIYLSPFVYIVILLMTSFYFLKKMNNEKNIHETKNFNFSFLEGYNLTSKEMQIAELISCGLSNKEISEKLKVSENTTKTHAGKIYRKIGVRSRYEMIGKAKNNPKE